MRRSDSGKAGDHGYGAKLSFPAVGGKYMFTVNLQCGPGDGSPVFDNRNDVCTPEIRSFVIVIYVLVLQPNNVVVDFKTKWGCPDGKHPSTAGGGGSLSAGSVMLIVYVIDSARSYKVHRLILLFPWFSANT
jgi:hypothetical protein